MRFNALRSTISTIVNRVHKEKKLEIMAEILVDPQTDFFAGAERHFAQEITMLSQVSPHLLMHFYPFSPLPSSEADIEQLISNLTPIVERLMNTRNSLYVWQPDSQLFPLFRTIQHTLGSDQIFFTEQQPRSYLDRRTLHLDLQM